MHIGVFRLLVLFGVASASGVFRAAWAGSAGAAATPKPGDLKALLPESLRQAVITSDACPSLVVTDQ